MQEEYKPISCSWHDLLLHKATLKEKVSLGLHSGKELSGVIEDVFTKAKEEFLKLQTGEIVRLDAISHLDGKPINSDYC